MRDTELILECKICKEARSIMVEDKDFIEFRDEPRGARRYIQDIFPYLSPGERELLISGTCSSCFDELFSYKEEE